METRLRYYRKRKGLTQTELANEVGCTKQTIINLEKGKVPRSVEITTKICLKLDTDIRDIFLP